MSAVPVCPPPGQVNLLWLDMSLDRLSGHPILGSCLCSDTEYHLNDLPPDGPAVSQVFWLAKVEMLGQRERRVCRCTVVRQFAAPSMPSF